MTRLRAALEATLIGSGILLLGSNVWVVGSSTWAAREDRIALEREITAREELEAHPLAAPAPPAPIRAEDAAAQLAVPEPSPDAKEWSPARLKSWRESRPAKAGERLALLEIPRVGLQVTVLEGTSEWALTRGVGRIEGTAGSDEAGNLGIAGHRDGYFRALRHLRAGDRIRLRTPAADRSYRVEWIRVVRPQDRWVLERTPQAALTLVTCYPFWFIGHAPKRFIVRALAEPSPVEREAGPAAARAAPARAGEGSAEAR
jgi:sortase A